MLPARVIQVDADRAEIEMDGGLRVRAAVVSNDRLEPGDHVLVDRGVVVEKLSATEADAIRAIYAEMGEMLSAAE